jgi:hypothetical protein
MGITTAILHRHFVERLHRNFIPRNIRAHVVWDVIRESLVYVLIAAPGNFVVGVIGLLGEAGSIDVAVNYGNRIVRIVVFISCPHGSSPARVDGAGTNTRQDKSSISHIGIHRGQSRDHFGRLVSKAIVSKRRSQSGNVSEELPSLGGVDLRPSGHMDIFGLGLHNKGSLGVRMLGAREHPDAANRRRHNSYKVLQPSIRPELTFTTPWSDLVPVGEDLSIRGDE